jgi:hypothetical protein
MVVCHTKCDITKITFKIIQDTVNIEYWLFSQATIISFIKHLFNCRQFRFPVFYIKNVSRTSFNAKLQLSLSSIRLCYIKCQTYWIGRIWKSQKRKSCAFHYDDPRLVIWTILISFCQTVDIFTLFRWMYIPTYESNGLWEESWEILR